MDNSSETSAIEISRAEWALLAPHEREVIEGILHHSSIPRDPNKEYIDRRTLGERAADAIAAFGGSWSFILLFVAWLLFWTVLNTEILGPRNYAFDPYPYIFLNLILSMLAAIQAPIIMMSQKRQATRDRIEAEIDHELNVRAELAIRHVDERLHSIEQRLFDLSSISERQACTVAELSAE